MWRLLRSNHFWDSFTVAAMNFITRVRGVILLPLIVKTLGLGQFGIWTQCISISTLLTGFFEFNFHTFIVRMIPEEKDPARQNIIWFSTLLLLLTLNACFVGIILALYQVLDFGQSFFRESESSSYLLIAVLGSPFVAVFTYNMNYFRAIQKIRPQVIASAIVTTMELVGIVFFIKAGGILVALKWILGWRIATCVASCLIILGRTGMLKPSMNKMRDAFKFCYPLIYANLSSLVMDRADRIIIGALFGSVTLGLYAVGANLGSLIRSVLAPFQYTLLPKMSQLWKENTDSAISLVNQYRHVFLLLAIPTYIFIVFFGTEIMTILSKASFVGWSNYVVLITVTFANILWGLCIFEMFLLIGQQRIKTIAGVRFAVAVLNIGFNLMAIEFIGFWAAGFVLIISYVVLFVGYSKKAGVKLKFNMATLAASGALAAVLCHMIHLVGGSLVKIQYMATGLFLYYSVYFVIFYLIYYLKLIRF